MHDAGDPARQEEVVARLRELHLHADEQDQPRAALYLGLALADLIAVLPADDGRRGDLAGEGLARLTEAADSSPAAVAAAERLTACRTAAEAAAAERAQGPAVFPLKGADLNWELDWEALRGPSEAARNLTTMLPALASMLPPQETMRQSLVSSSEVLEAFAQGQWSPERDAALRAAIAQVERGGLGHGLALMLLTGALIIRTRRCMEVRQQGGEPYWPSPAELEDLIADLESAEDLAILPGPQFQA